MEPLEDSVADGQGDRDAETVASAVTTVADGDVDSEEPSVTEMEGEEDTLCEAETDKVGDCEADALGVPESNGVGECVAHTVANVSDGDGERDADSLG